MAVLGLYSHEGFSLAAVSRGYSSTACRIPPDQGSNLCLLHWQEDSLPLSHQGSPRYNLDNEFINPNFFIICKYHYHSVQFSHSVVSNSLRPQAARQASLSIINSQSLPKLTSIESVMPSSHLVLCYPLFLLPPIPPSVSLFH